jgi:hypothetical protein
MDAVTEAANVCCGARPDQNCVLASNRSAEAVLEQPHDSPAHKNAKSYLGSSSPANGAANEKFTKAPLATETFDGQTDVAVTNRTDH